MFNALIRGIRSVDILLLHSMAILFAFGCAALYSIGLGKEPQSFFYLHKQLTVFGIFCAALVLVASVNYRIYRDASIVFYCAVCAVLGAVLIFGSTIRGTRGWFVIGGVGVQPAELAKLALIFILARYLSHFAREIRQARHLLITGLLAAIPIGLILAQPDFGSAAVLFVIWFGMMLVSGIPRRYLLALAVLGVILGAAAWSFGFKEYQKQRIITYLSPGASDQKGSGYNVRQAMIAIGSGQLFGRGLGLGSQSHLKFLPESQTDFIFSVLAEETGLVGVFLLFLFWILFFYRLIASLRSASDDFGAYTILGISIFFFVHVLLNIGGNLGLVPLTGLVLPFMSYGGSALAVSLLSVGVVLSVRSHSV